jgi:hypothetical protein
MVTHEEPPFRETERPADVAAYIDVIKGPPVPCRFPMLQRLKPRMRQASRAVDRGRGINENLFENCSP